MTDEEIIVRTAAEFTERFSARARQAGVQLTFFAWNHAGEIQPQEPVQQLRVAAFGSSTLPFDIATIEFLQAGKGDGAARARLQGFQGNVIGNLLAFKSD